jgi:hypothetical protein
MEEKHIYAFLIVSIVVLTSTAFFFSYDKSLTGAFIHESLPPTGLPSSTTNITTPATTQATSTVIATTTNITELERQITRMQSQVSNLQSSVTSMQQGLNTNQGSYNSLQQEVGRLNANLQTIQAAQQQLQQQLQSQQNQVATGLAGLQRTVDTTKNELVSVNKTLQEQQASTKTTINFIFFFFIILITGGGIAWYLMIFKSKQQPHAEIQTYITQHIKNGMKYPTIRENLLKAGWSEEDIKWAYQGTAKSNYKQYNKKNKPTKQKAIAIAGVSLLIILIVAFFFTKGTSTGQAFQFYGGASDFEEDIPINPAIARCFPPDILVNNACCPDLNNNSICDTTDGYTEEPQSVQIACSDNIQCSSGRSCINKVCQFIAEQYSTQDCQVKCNIIRVHLTAFHQDSTGRIISTENYTLRPGLGSYTGAGALQWTLLPVPDYCNANRKDVPVPIEIKTFDNSQRLSTEVITLKADNEEILTHPTVDLRGFTLRVNDLFHTCGGSTYR